MRALRRSGAQAAQLSAADLLQQLGHSGARDNGDANSVNDTVHGHSQ
jgi:hypothetical protein